MQIEKPPEATMFVILGSNTLILKLNHYLRGHVALLLWDRLPAEVKLDYAAVKGRPGAAFG